MNFKEASVSAAHILSAISENNIIILIYANFKLNILVKAC